MCFQIHPKKAMAKIKRMQRRVILLRSNLSTDVSDATLNPAMAKTAIPTQETIALRMMPKKTIPPNQASSKLDGRMGKLSLINRQWMETRRMTITCPSPKMR